MQFCNCTHISPHHFECGDSYKGHAKHWGDMKDKLKNKRNPHAHM